MEFPFSSGRMVHDLDTHSRAFCPYTLNNDGQTKRQGKNQAIPMYNLAFLREKMSLLLVGKNSNTHLEFETSALATFMKI